MDNRYSPKIAQRNADVLVREKVDLVIEFQTDEHVAPIVAAKYREAGIPLIAIEVPHPGATYFGANNYEAGLIGGRHLGRWAKQHWHADVNEIVLMALERAGSLPKMRLTGMLVGMKETCPPLENCQVTYLEGDGKLGESFEAMRRHLRATRAKRFLIGAINDPSALGALRALQEAGRSESCAIMGQNASPEGRAELRTPGTRLIGSVAYFPGKVRRRHRRRRARYSPSPFRAARGLRQASARHTGDRRSHLSERSLHAGHGLNRSASFITLRWGPTPSACQRSLPRSFRRSRR